MRDFVDIQFFVNRENGQSKVCTVTLESEQSLQRILKKIPKKIIHGQKPVVKYPYSQTLFMVMICLLFQVIILLHFVLF